MIASVLDSKNDVNSLPGLEAMNPFSEFIKVINNPKTNYVIDNRLIVISGNCKTKINLKALLIIASRIFYTKNNDLVVNTGSMYQGTRRSGNIQYFFDESPEVDHFHYFKNNKTNAAIVLALQTGIDGMIPGFTQLDEGSAEAMMDRNAILHPAGGQVFKDTVTGAKPILVLLPGIMGSNLTIEDELVWMNYWSFISGDLIKLDINSKRVIAPSIIKTSYEQFVNYFSDKYDVITFPYDWRIQLSETANLFNEKIKELLKYRQPIKVAGHSMGGVLVRDFIIKYPDTWKELNESAGFKLIFLGSPLGGSYVIPSVLFGQDDIIGKLSMIDVFHNKRELVKLFSRMPGVLSLLPYSTDANNNFGDKKTWDSIIKEAEIDDWETPSAQDLKAFSEHRDDVRNESDKIDYTNIVYIAGKDKSTVCGYRIEKNNRGSELVFLSTGEGDKSVTWDTGIPEKMIGTDSVYYTDVTHGELANEPSMFKGISEIFSAGRTNLLSRVRPAVRGEEKLFRTPGMDNLDVSSEGIQRTILGLRDERETTPSEMLIRVSVSRGDLYFASYPILAGHFINDGILYAEESIDQYMDKALSERHMLGLYPGETGTSEIFLSKMNYEKNRIDNLNNFSGAIVVGLGEPGKLTASELTKTIEQGITSYLLDINSSRLKDLPLKINGKTGISSLVIGSGFGGLNIESSVRAIIEGIQNANTKMKNMQKENIQIIEEIEFVELYEDKATSCFYSISTIEKESRTLNIVKEGKTIKTLLGSKKRIPVEKSEGWWNRITVSKKEDIKGNITCLQFNSSTGSAREEQKDLLSSPKVIEQLIEDISTNNKWSDTKAKTIFELLIPNDFKPQLKRRGNISWILDKYTASYPWELLHDTSNHNNPNIAKAKPICVSAGMIRQLATQNYRLTVNSVTKNKALVIGDPQLNGFANQLDGAYREGEMVSKVLKEKGFDPMTILKGTSGQIIESIFSDDYKIVHLAGHGIFNEDISEYSGMLIGDGVCLSTREISQMSSVPELVFVNCCYLGKTEGAAEELFSRRYKLAANIGTQLIENGVKAVIAAGWAVDDAAAMEFTKVFYNRMFAGDNFGDSIRKARETIYDNYPGTNTWGAYQCYGDPFYRIMPFDTKNRSSEIKYLIEEEAEVDLSNLLNDIERSYSLTEDYLKKLFEITKAVDKAEIRNAKITEKEAIILAALNEYDLSIAKFKVLLDMENASFSFSAVEKYCSVRSKKYVSDFKHFPKKRQKLISSMNKVIKDLEILIKVGPTSERYTLLASTIKRRAFLTSEIIQKTKAYSDAAYYYYCANNIHQDSDGGAGYRSFALTNWFETENALVLSGQRKWGGNVDINGKRYDIPPLQEALKILKTIKASLNNPAEKTDYWDLINSIKLKLCLFIMPDEILNEGKVKPAKTAKSGSKNLKEQQERIDDILQEFQNLWKCAGSRAKRQAEIEHIDFLIDALTLKNTAKTRMLRGMLQKLNDELVKIV